MPRCKQLLEILVALLITLTVEAKKPSNAILLSTVKSLTFHNGKKTTARRVAAVPQMTCIGGNACGFYAPDVVRCTNAGASYSDEDVEWTCTAPLPEEFKFGSTDVVCEGYDSAKDDYVLKGSCALEYRLILTDAGEERYGRGWGRSYHGGEPASPLAMWLFWIVFISVAGFMLYSAFFRRDTTGNIPRAWGAGGWGGDDNDDPPPPYQPYGSFGPKSSMPRTSHRTSSYASSQAGRQNEGWRPGFWTGLAAGGAGGWWAGRGQRQQYPRESSWWGGGNDYQEGSSTGRRSGAFGGSSGSSFSSTTRTSTGFGGTRRR